MRRDFAGPKSYPTGHGLEAVPAQAFVLPDMRKALGLATQRQASSRVALARLDAGNGSLLRGLRSSRHQQTSADSMGNARLLHRGFDGVEPHLARADGFHRLSRLDGLGKQFLSAGFFQLVTPAQER